MAQSWDVPRSIYTSQNILLLSPVENTGLLSPFSMSSNDTQSPNPAPFDTYEGRKMVQPQTGENLPKAILPYPPSRSLTQRSRIEQVPSNRRMTSRIQLARRNRRIITQSSQYKAYRVKQDQQQDGQMWSADLEEAFLNGI